MPKRLDEANRQLEEAEQYLTEEDVGGGLPARRGGGGGLPSDMVQRRVANIGTITGEEYPPSPAGSASTTSTTLPSKYRELSDFERAMYARKVEKLKEKLAKLPRKTPAEQGIQDIQDRYGRGMFPKEEAAAAPPAFPRPPEPSKLQKAAEVLAPSVGSYAGSTAAMSYAAPYAASAGPVAGPVIMGGAAVAGAMAGGGGARLTMEGVKSTFGLPGGLDSIDDYFNAVKESVVEEGIDEATGQGAGAAVSKFASPRKAALNVGSSELLEKYKRDLRGAYESIIGRDMVEETSAIWNPYRWLRGAETELDDTNVATRLREFGTDPAAARRVALTGGAIPASIQHDSFLRYTGAVNRVTLTPDELYNVARSKLTAAAGLERLAVDLTQTLPPAQMGEMIHMAVNNQFNLLTTARDQAMKALEKVVGAGAKGPFTAAGITRDYIIDFSRMKRRVNPNSVRGADVIIQGMPDRISFGKSQEIRKGLATIVFDERLPMHERQKAEAILGSFDKATEKGLPAQSRDLFRKWTDADNPIYEENYHTKFVQKLLEDPPSAAKYAAKLIDEGDVRNFNKLEKALSRTPDAKQLLDSMRLHIGQEAFRSAVNAREFIDPAKLPAILHTEGKGYGKEFLTAVMGPDYVQNFEAYTEVMQTVNKAASNMGTTVANIRMLPTLVGGGLTSIMYGPGVAGAMSTAATAVGFGLLSPFFVSKALASPRSARQLLKIASDMAAGKNPMRVSRMSTRLLDDMGVGPTDLLQRMGWVDPSAANQKALRTMGAYAGPAPAAPPPGGGA